VSDIIQIDIDDFGGVVAAEARRLEGAAEPNSSDLYDRFKQHPVVDARDHALAEGAPEPPKPRHEVIEDMVSVSFCVMLASGLLSAWEENDRGPTTTDRSE